MENKFRLFWHGTPSGDLRGSSYGLHIGTYQAAKEALEAKIGIPVEGSWDGTREYGKTLLAGKRTLKERDPKGYNITGYNCDAPEDDYYPTGKAQYPNGDFVSLSCRPIVLTVNIAGPMSNTPSKPMEDMKANSTMASMLKRGCAKRGYFYKNISEDAGSISAVVPNSDHLKIVSNI